MNGATINGVPLAGGSLLFPLVGAWLGRFTVLGDDTSAIAGPATVAFGDTNLSGFATVGIDEGQRVTVEVVGGAGGLGAPVTPQHYLAPSVQAVLQSVLGAGGEALSGTSDASVTTPQLTQWTTIAGQVTDALKSALAASGASWRVLSDGTVWVGQETWPTSSAGHTLEEEDPTQSIFRIAIDGADVLPGVTFRSQKVTEARYYLDDRAIRADIIYGVAARGGIKGALDELQRRALASTVFLTPFLARVAGQNADGTLELLSGDPRFPNMSRIKLRAAPGVTTLKVVPQTMVIVAFEGGLPDKPYASVADLTQCQALTMSAIESIELTAGAVKAGGNQSLVLHAALSEWVTALKSAGTSIGLAVPDLIAADTQILKGA